MQRVMKTVVFLMFAELINFTVGVSDLIQDEHEIKSTLKIQYCYHCGYLEEFKKHGTVVQRMYPNISVEGEEFGPSSYCSALVRTLSAVKMLLIACVLSRVNFFVGAHLQKLWAMCKERRFLSTLVMYCVFTYFENYSLESGAFEVFLNGHPIWSTLEIGRLPHHEELLYAISRNYSTQYSHKIFSFDEYK